MVKRSRSMATRMAETGRKRNTDPDMWRNADGTLWHDGAMDDPTLRVAYVRRLAARGAARAMREAAGLSVRDLAKSLSVSPSTVSRCERGQSRPRADFALRWAALLDDLGRAA